MGYFKKKREDGSCPLKTGELEHMEEIFPIKHMKFKEPSASWLDFFVFHIVFTFILELFCLFS